jgi:hypothetical protein
MTQILQYILASSIAGITLLWIFIFTILGMGAVCEKKYGIAVLLLLLSVGLVCVCLGTWIILGIPLGQLIG